MKTLLLIALAVGGYYYWTTQNSKRQTLIDFFKKQGVDLSASLNLPTDAEIDVLYQGFSYTQAGQPVPSSVSGQIDVIAKKYNIPMS